MTKPVKIGLISAGALIGLFILAAIILVATVNPNEYKPEIAQIVKENTGRDLRFDGDISFNFFPWLGLNVGPMALGNASGFTPNEMLRINKAEASIQILPLLSGNVAIGTVVLDGFTLNLAVNKQGITNWDDLTKKEDKPADINDESAAEKSKDSGSTLESLSVQGVEITNANVVYDDQKTGQKASLTKLDLIIGEVGDKLPTPFELSFDLKLDNPKIDTRPKLTGVATFDMGTSTFEISDLLLKALGMNISGVFIAKSSDNGLNYSGELKLAQTNLKSLFAQLGMEAPATTDPKALEKFSTDIKINGTADSASLENLTIILDDTTITGTGSVKNFAKPAIGFAVNVDDIDVDRYLPPTSEKTNTEAPPAAGSKDTDPAQEPDLTGLKELDLTAKLTVGKLKAMNLRITEILCETRAKKGVLTVKPFTAKLYEGNISLQSVLNANSKLATWQERADLKDVQVGPLLKDLVGKDHLLGTTVVKYDVNGSGLTPDNIKKSLSGTASFAFTDGAINGVNIAKMLRDAFNSIKGKPSSSDTSEKTDFAELLGSAAITKGHITNKDLLMKSPLLRVTGKGWADLPKNSVDYLATVTVVGTLKGQDGASLEELSGLPLPIYAKGSLDDPSIGLDVKAMAEALLKNTFKEGTKGLEDSLRKSILGGGEKPSGTEEKKPGGFLKNLF